MCSSDLVIYTLLKKHPHLLKTFYTAKELDKETLKLVRNTEVKITKVDPQKAQALAKGGNHQGLLAEIDSPLISPPELSKLSHVLVLVGVTDMGNIGAIIRSAYALGVEAIFICGSKQLNIEGAVRTSSGAIFDMPIALHPNLYDLAHELSQSGFSTIGATLNGKETLPNIEKSALFLGSEDLGLPNRLVSKLDLEMTIKMKHQFDSLNVSSAAAILIDRINHAIQ